MKDGHLPIKPDQAAYASFVRSGADCLCTICFEQWKFAKIERIKAFMNKPDNGNQSSTERSKA